MKNNKKFLFCEFCGFKKIIDDLTNLCVIKNINIQGKIEKNTKIGKEIYEKIVAAQETIEEPQSSTQQIIEFGESAHV